MKGGPMGGYVKIIDGDKVYEATIIKLLDDDLILIQLLNGRRLTLNSNDVTITVIGHDN